MQYEFINFEKYLYSDDSNKEKDLDISIVLEEDEVTNNMQRPESWFAHVSVFHNKDGYDIFCAAYPDEMEDIYVFSCDYKNIMNKYNNENKWDEINEIESFVISKSDFLQDSGRVNFEKKDCNTYVLIPSFGTRNGKVILGEPREKDAFVAEEFIRLQFDLVDETVNYDWMKKVARNRGKSIFRVGLIGNISENVRENLRYMIDDKIFKPVFDIGNSFIILEDKKRIDKEDYIKFFVLNTKSNINRMRG